MIIQKNNPILRETSKEIRNAKSAETQDLIKKLAETMFAEPDGIGIAAPQIGIPRRIFLVSEEALQISKKESPETKDEKTRGYIVFINPVFKKISTKKSKDVEGCLSVRGIYGEVARPEKVTVEYYDEKGTMHQRGASNLFARVLQHEMDHLNGKLFIDRAENLKKL